MTHIGILSLNTLDVFISRYQTHHGLKSSPHSTVTQLACSDGGVSHPLSIAPSAITPPPYISDLPGRRGILKPALVIVRQGCRSLPGKPCVLASAVSNLIYTLIIVWCLAWVWRICLLILSLLCIWLLLFFFFVLRLTDFVQYAHPIDVYGLVIIKRK